MPFVPHLVQAPDLVQIGRRTTSKVLERAEGRMPLMMDVLLRTARRLLSGPRHGRKYRLRGRWYTASAPSEMPGRKTGALIATMTVTPTESHARGDDGGGYATSALKFNRFYARRLATIRGPQFPARILEEARAEMRSIAHRKLLT